MNLSKGKKLTNLFPSPAIFLSDVLEDIFDGPRRIRFESHGAPYIRLGDLAAGEIYFDPSETIAPLDLDPRFYLRSGDVLVSKTGDELRSVVTSDETKGALTAPDIYCLRVQTKHISPTWLAYYLNSSYGQKMLSERSSGATVRRLCLAGLRSLPLFVPPLSISIEIESLESQAQDHTRIAHEIWTAIRNGIYVEITSRCGCNEISDETMVNEFLAKPEVQKVFRPLGEVAQIAVSSRKLLKPDQIVNYVQASDIDPQSFLFRRLRSARSQDLPSRIRLPLHAYQVLLLASGSNLGTQTHPVAIVDAELEGGFASNTFLALEFTETPIYYAIALKHPIVLAQLHQMATGAVVRTLRKKEIIHLCVPQLSSVWRQDFNDRAQLAWERRSLALALRRQAHEKVEEFIQQMI